MPATLFMLLGCKKIRQHRCGSFLISCMKIVILPVNPSLLIVIFTFCICFICSAHTEHQRTSLIKPPVDGQIMIE